jgi:hypothetical protein
VIDEAGLHRLPLDGESLPLVGAEIADFQGFDPGLAVGKFCFGPLRGAVLEDSAAVLRSEAIAEGQSACSALMNEPYNCDDNEEDQYNCGTDKLGIREVIKHCVLLCGNSSAAKGEWERLPYWGRTLHIINRGRQGVLLLAGIAHCGIDVPERKAWRKCHLLL